MNPTRVEVRALCRPIKLFHTDLDKQFLSGPRFVHGPLSCWNRKGSSPTVATKLEVQNHCMLLRYYVPSLELRSLARNMENSPRPLFLLHQALQLAQIIGSGSILLSYAKPRLVRLTARWWNVIHHSREHVSNPTESNGDKLYTTPANAWHCAWWS
jgi:hypothetical protein